MATITAETTMGELLAKYPGAQRALFAKYHIGGCQSCGFSPQETLANVLERNESIPLEEVVEFIHQNHDADARIFITPPELKTALEAEPAPRLIDIRTREEHDAVQLPGALFFSQELTQEIFGTWDKETRVVVYDHTGDRCLDAAAYFIGHGFANTRALQGGIDAWSLEVDESVPRYRVELE